MDMTMLDVTDVPNVLEGDEVVILGRQGEEMITAAELAEKINTISYEILTLWEHGLERLISIDSSYRMRRQIPHILLQKCVAVAEETGRILLFLLATLKQLVLPPFELTTIFRQMLEVGVRSVPVCLW